MFAAYYVVWTNENEGIEFLHVEDRDAGYRFIVCNRGHELYNGLKDCMVLTGAQLRSRLQQTYGDLHLAHFCSREGSWDEVREFGSITYLAHSITRLDRCPNGFHFWAWNSLDFSERDISCTFYVTEKGLIQSGKTLC